MRLPLAPSRPPATDTVAAGSAFGVISMLRSIGDRTPHVHQRVANSISREDGWEDQSSVLVEQMVGAFAQRCDHLIEDIEACQMAPALFDPLWPITVMSAGSRNEEWMMFWSTMRKPVKR